MDAASFQFVRESVVDRGFAVIPSFALPQVVEDLTREISALVASNGERLSPHGVRNLAAHAPSVGQLASSPQVQELVGGILGGAHRLVRSILFDKVPGANWNVAWHQDLTIAVVERREVDGFGPWSVKEGVVSVQPPAAILESMITLRLHLDDCGIDNGPVRVIPGSHRFGRLDPAHIDDLVSSATPVQCVGNRGSALLMRPLLLHASSKASTPTHRRVVHLDFAGCDLPAGLNWAKVA